jgi:long-subunit acyl-CoA synthetase (AMP-forming)
VIPLQVSILSPNCPATYEVNFGVPMARAVLNSINSRLDARTVSVLLSHSETKLLFVDSQYLQIAQEALQIWLSSPDAPAKNPHIIVIEDSLDPGRVDFRNSLPELVEYEELLESGNPEFPIQWPQDDWETISLNYTSGTTSRPKGVLYHHRYRKAPESNLTFPLTFSHFFLQTGSFSYFFYTFLYFSYTFLYFSDFFQRSVSDAADPSAVLGRER